jgi:hydrogenase maturation protease
MNRALIDKVVNAVLYEGYILYPYRPSSKKNQVGRFTFGRVYPEDYAAAQGGREPCAMQTEFLVRNESKDAVANVSVRFLHPLARDVGRLAEPRSDLPDDSEPAFEVVPRLQIDDKLFQTWLEAMEREVIVPPFVLNEPRRLEHPFHFDAARTLEPLRDKAESIVGVIVRRQAAIDGILAIDLEPSAHDAMKIRVRILNRTSVPDELLENQEAITLRTFASTHTILHVEGGECISLLDPDGHYLEAAKACKQIGTWPVLIGDEKIGERDAMLSSPIILYDYPKIAAESPGDLFDGAEIDEILTLRIQTMTDDEKSEMRQVDEQARKILERTENLATADLLKMHGVMRDVRATHPNEEFFNPQKPLETVTVSGVALKAGDRVRIRPKKRADVMDIALNGKIGIIESVMQDVDDSVQFALVLEDDPGRDLGMMRQPGHRFFYSADEVEPVGN